MQQVSTRLPAIQKDSGSHTLSFSFVIEASPGPELLRDSSPDCDSGLSAIRVTQQKRMHTHTHTHTCMHTQLVVFYLPDFSYQAKFLLSPASPPLPLSWILLICTTNASRHPAEMEFYSLIQPEDRSFLVYFRYIQSPFTSKCYTNFKSARKSCSLDASKLMK